MLIYIYIILIYKRYTINKLKILLDGKNFFANYLCVSVKILSYLLIQFSINCCINNSDNLIELKFCNKYIAKVKLSK